MIYRDKNGKFCSKPKTAQALKELWEFCKKYKCNINPRYTSEQGLYFENGEEFLTGHGGICPDGVVISGFLNPKTEPEYFDIMEDSGVPFFLYTGENKPNDKRFYTAKNLKLLWHSLD